jgi:hypothetical protein
MRIRKYSLLAAIALLLAACGSDGSEDTTTSSAPAETTSTAPEPSAEAVLLSYTLEPGASFEYEVEMDQTIEMTTSGDTAALGEEEELPGEMSIGMSGTSVFTHTVSEGPEPGTYSIDITGDFSGLEITGTVDGEPVDSSEIPELAEMGPVDVTVVVDEQGNVIPDDSGLGADMFGDLGGLGMLEQFGSGATPGQFIGPPFSGDEVTVGDTWSETVETPAMPDQDPITTQIDSEVVGTEDLDGNEVFVIETTTTTSAIEFDLGELLIGFMTAFVPEDASDEELAQIEALTEDLRFAFSIDETVGDLTTWFDHEAGFARQAEYRNTTHMVMDVNIPDETTGDLVAFGLDMNIDQDVTYRLTDTDNA